MRDFLTHEGVRVTAICDVNQRNIAAARQIIGDAYGKPDVRVFADFHALNSDSSLDAVLMALPVHWHSIPALDAIVHGKHIYHEKPMAMSFEEARHVREAVRRKKVVFQFGTQQRSDLKFRWACELALNGRLGKLKEIQVSAPGGRQRAPFPKQPVPDYVNWDRWVGPAPMTPFHEEKLVRDNHENISNFSLGMISCWGIHHLDIAQWGNGADRTGPTAIVGEGSFPKAGGFDAIVSWNVRFEYTGATPVTFVSDGTPGFRHGIRFVGDAGWVHVLRGVIDSSDERLLRDPQNKCGAMPIKLPVSNRHTYNFVEAVKSNGSVICDVETAVRSDTLCQLALIAVKRGRKIQWDPTAERLVADAEAAALLQPRAFRGPWKLPALE
jgi:predicted dehydrogenase